MKLITSVHINTAENISGTPVYEKLELFDFESIELTSSIQDVRDIGSVFTDFSQQFTIPASQTNNRLLNHFYNESIINGYDARVKRKGYITLNGITFRDGYIRLSEAILRNGKPYSYSITFFGQIVSLKDILGDNELKSLNDLTQYNHLYNLTNVYNGFKTNLFSGDIIYPSISSSNKWYYDTSGDIPDGVEGAEIKFNQGYSKNLYVSDNTADLGIKFTELKPAIKVKRIIEAIESKYASINFSNDFFSSDVIDDLYFFINKNKGDVENLGEDNEFLVSNFDVGSDAETGSTMTSSVLELDPEFGTYEPLQLTITVDPADIAKEYNIIIYDTSGEEVYNEILTGSPTISIPANVGQYTVYIKAETVVTFTKFRWFVTLNYRGDSGSIVNATKGYDTNNIPFSNEFIFDITRQMPNMKIIDFLKGLFNMFNLTAYVEDGEIVVKTLNDFYADGNTIDLSNELDLSEVSIKRAELYSNIEFKFSDPKTFGVINQNEVHQDNFGNTKFKAVTDSSEGSVVLDGGKYEVKLPFEKLFFERLSNRDDGELIPFSHGWLANKDQNETITAPILFYNINETIDDTIYNIGFKQVSEHITTYNRPSNIKSDDSQTLHFDVEESEATGVKNYNSLFKIFYNDYISNLFNKSSRLVTYNTVLKLNTLLSYNMNDLILINGKEYRINTIKTNLSNGKSEIELLTNYEITT